jgi:hypothetical protein
MNLETSRNNWKQEEVPSVATIISVVVWSIGSKLWCISSKRKVVGSKEGV